MTPQEIFAAYFNALEQPGSLNAYPQRALWTPVATTALVRVGLQAFPQGNKGAKNHCDPYGRSEYLTLDVSITDPVTWGPPLFISEHEQFCGRAKVQYCAWKLLSVDAKQRVLVTYFGKGTDFATVGELEQAVREVCQDHPGKELLLIAADYDAHPASHRELVAIHHTRVIGVES